MMSNRELSVYHYVSCMTFEELKRAYVNLSLKHDDLVNSLSQLSPVFDGVKSLDAVIFEDKKLISVGNSLGTTINVDWLRKNDVAKGDIVKQLTIKL